MALILRVLWGNNLHWAPLVLRAAFPGVDQLRPQPRPFVRGQQKTRCPHALRPDRVPGGQVVARRTQRPFSRRTLLGSAATGSTSRTGRSAPDSTRLLGSEMKYQISWKVFERDARICARPRASTWIRSPVPLWDWGCAAWSCVDAVSPDGPMSRHERGFTVTRFHLADWLVAWRAGVELHAEIFEIEEATIINPFTRRPMIIHRRGNAKEALPNARASRISVATSRSAASSVRRARSSSSAVFAGSISTRRHRASAPGASLCGALVTSPANRERAVGSRGVSVEKPRSRGALAASTPLLGCRDRFWRIARRDCDGPDRVWRGARGVRGGLLRGLAGRKGRSRRPRARPAGRQGRSRRSWTGGSAGRKERARRPRARPAGRKGCSRRPRAHPGAKPNVRGGRELVGDAEAGRAREARVQPGRSRHRRQLLRDA